MAEEMNTDPIIDALATGSISAEEALAQFVAAGMTKEQALYIIRSMEDVDVMHPR